MRKIRVAHVITRLCAGGAQENTFHTVRLANRDRFEADLISGVVRGGEKSMEDQVHAAGVPIIRMPFLIREPAPVRDWITLRRLIRLFKTRQYDIVHTHTSKAGVLGRLAAERAGVPIIVHTPHGNVFHSYFNPYLTRLFVWMERHCARRTDRIIELTSGGVEEHLAEGIGRREQFSVIFSGIDTAPSDAAIAKREATRAALGMGPEEVLIGGVGRLEPVKGFTYFVEAARSVLRSDAHARCILIGDGAERETLRTQAAGMGDRFQFLGWRRDVPELMAAMDILAVPSVNEGMGRVVLEAGAAGVPVAASRVGGIPDIVDDGETGLLITARDAGALAEAMLELAHAPERRRWMGATARAKVVPHFSLQKMVERIEALYEELLYEKKLDSRR
ncbi:MAG TPA: glycosyltransferase family 4 protein [Candidatus Hydrogenedentes bacterium]|mgnify:CR=1 FL=1|nr:glycosyltransferase family 4 protein [Candidatus Hydrogenedentota bacterium]